MIEDATSWTISPDGTTFFYCTNATDVERRHIWAVPVAGGTARQITTGTGIETYPAPLASGKTVATLSASWNMPQSLGIWSAPATQKIVFPTARPGFPTAAHVEPELVITHPEDNAFEIHNQLFVPKNIRSGEKRPAIVFVHGGPVRQMLLGYHYRYVYHQFYGINEWLASKGYVVLSVNYRAGVGYGNSFRRAPNVAPNGIAELQDVVAGAKYLQSRPDVDPARIGIYGLSYGGLLTAQALARHSDIFAAGVDYAGVHLYGSSLDPETTTYQASAISQIDNWKSPVLIIQGDDDRNVSFAQTVGLVQLLRQRDVYYELIVQPDDVHDSLRHDRWIEWLERMGTFLQKFLDAGHVVRTGDPVKRGYTDADFPRVQKLAEGVYSYEQLRSAGTEKFTTVSLFVVTSAGVLVADGQGSMPETQRMIAEIGKVTKQPITHLVIGSDHGDHTAGNAAFPPSVKVYAHPVSKATLDKGASGVSPQPITAVEEKLTLKLGSTEIQILFLGRAHTGGDLSVYLPREKVLFMSEAYLNRIFPAMRSAYPSEWVATIEMAQKMDVTTYVPGHGFVESPAILKEELETARKALVQVIAEAKRLHSAGVPAEEAVTLARFGDLDSWTIKPSQAATAIRRVYLELEGKLK